MINDKKTLIISTYSPPAIGGPQNLYNLLKDTPVNLYCILTSFYNIDNTSAQKGTWLDCEYVFYDNFGKNKDFLISNSKKEVKSRSFITWLKHLIKSSVFFRNLLGVPIIFGQIMMIIRTSKKVIYQKKIEKIIAISDYGPALIASYFISRKNNISLILFFFDIYKGNFFPFPGSILASIFEPKLIKKAEKIIVTNNGTADFYIKRYGEEIRKKIVVIHNSTFAEPYLKLHTSYNPKPPYTILFTGRIYWPQIRSIKNLIRTIEQIKEFDIIFKIYCPNPSDYLKKIGIQKTEKIKILKPLPSEEMPKIQTKADILFLPLSWKTKSPEIINTATPGKLTDYLISGRPILIHAPNSSFLVKYAKENGFALVVDKENIDSLKTAIKKLVHDKEFANQLIKNAQKTFFKNHDIIKNQEKLKNIIK